MWPACAVAAGHFLCRALYDAFEVLCLAAFSAPSAFGPMRSAMEAEVADVLSNIAAVVLIGLGLCLAGIAWARLFGAPAREYFGDQIDEDRP